MALSNGDVEAYLLNTGKQLFSATLAGISNISLTYFSVGDVPLTERNVNLIFPIGNRVFEGDASLLSVKLIGPDTVRYTVIFPEDVGPFDIGNIVLYGSLPNNVLTPLIHIILPFKYSKTPSSSTPSYLPNGLPNPGNRLVFNISVRHIFDSNNIEVYVEIPDFANVPSFDSETSVPPGEINPYNAFIVSKSINSKSPILAARSTDSTQWGMPLFNRITDPRFNVISGGVEGDKYETNPYDYISGGQYLTEDKYYKGFAGGSSYTTAEEDFFEYVGGIPYVPII